MMANDFTKDSTQNSLAGFSKKMQREMADGLLAAHGRISANTGRTLEATSFLYALVELLNEQGLVDIDELDERQQVVGRRLVERYRQSGSSVMLQDPEYDKYAFEQEAAVDCAGRVHLCRAACCRLPFALSNQDLREGIIRWELGQPYLIAHNGHGACIHLDPASRGCTVWENRPVPCRAFDCREDERIWLDFEGMIINPEVQRDDWPACLVGRSGEEHQA